MALCDGVHARISAASLDGYRPPRQLHLRIGAPGRGARNLGSVQDGHRSWRVQGRKRGRGLDLMQHRSVDDGVRTQRRSAVHYAVTDGLGRRPTARGQPAGEVCHGVELTVLQRFDPAGVLR